MSIQKQLLNTYSPQCIPPKGEFETFLDENHYKEKLKEWGLSASKEAKKEFWYKEKSHQQIVTIKGYETYGISAEYNTLVIQFNDSSLSCIHPAFLKEMQQSSFGKESIMKDEEKEASKRNTSGESLKTENKRKTTVKSANRKETIPEKEGQIQLPNEKVHFTAKVKQFSMTYNPFTEENDEVVILENIQIHEESPIPLDFAWCSHSKTLKKFELEAGDSIEFDGKVASKKLAKGKDVPEDYKLDTAVLYKINNPSKIVKHEKN